MFFPILTLLSFLGFATSTFALRLVDYPRTVVSCPNDMSACDLADINYTIRFEPTNIKPAIYMLHMSGDLEQWPATYYKNPGAKSREKFVFSRIKLRKNVNYWEGKAGEYTWSGVDGGGFIFGNFALEIEDGSTVNATEVLTMTYRDETYSKGVPTPASFPTPTPSSADSFFQYKVGEVTTTTSVSTTLSDTASAPSKTTSTSESTDPALNNAPATNNAAMSAGAKAGIGIGASIGVIAIAAGAFFLARRRYMTKGGSGGHEGKQELDADATEIYPKIPLQEMSAEKHAYELEHVQDPIEMDNAYQGGFQRPVSPQEMWGGFPSNKGH